MEQTLILPSGKGVNVARAVKTLGGEAVCVSFLAGHTGRQFADLAREEGLKGAWTWVDGETRIAAAIADPEAVNLDATLISEAGPLITPGDWERLAADALEQGRSAQMGCFSGSLPPGTPLDRFAESIQSLQALGCPLWVDCNEQGLRPAIKVGAFGIKANAAEIGAVVGLTVDDPESAYQAGKALHQEGVSCVVVTLGARGAVMVSTAGAYVAEPPAVAGISSVGSGDAFLAGLMLAWTRHLEPPEALRFATAAGAANTLCLGGGRFRLEDFEAALPGVSLRQVGSGG